MRTVWPWVFTARKKRTLDSHTVHSEDSDCLHSRVDRSGLSLCARVRNAVRRFETEKGNYPLTNAIIDSVRFLPLVSLENAHISKITIIVLL